MMADMDTEMDLDIGYTEEELAISEIEAIPDIELSVSRDTNVSIKLRLTFTQTDANEATPILNTPNDTTDANALEPSPHKVHFRGLDNLTTKDVRAFASEYFESYKPSHIEWIDDTSANMVYETPEIAQEALVAFAAVEIADVSLIPVLQTIPAKAFPAHPQTNLQVRLAVVGDRKQAGARDRSRFYLFNPEYDPAERRKRAGYKVDRRYRDREDGGYRSQRYDDREQEKREREADFDASLYDDDESAIAKRSARDIRNHGSSSGSESRGRDSARVRFGGGAGKELFPERVDGGRGRLRDRSASPLRESDEDLEMRESRSTPSRQQDTAASANRLKAQMIKSRLKEVSSTKELFPQKTTSHRRSGAFDAADETVADLFANKMPVPFVDGSGDSNPRDIPMVASRDMGRNSGNGSTAFNIRGTAKALPTSVFSIKGAAASRPRVKELFPSTLGDNAGKELFSERLNGRAAQRQKASDLFY
jgi:Nuclear cap-binding protein subunit 3